MPWRPQAQPQCSACHGETIKPLAVTHHSLLWTSHVTSTILLSLFVSCSVTHFLALSPPCAPSPQCTVWALVYKQRDSVSHPESWTKTRTCREKLAGCVTLTHRSPTSSSPQMPNVLFRPCSSLFYSLEWAVGTGLHFTDIRRNLYTLADMSFRTIHICKIQFISHISTLTQLHYPYILQVCTLQLV